MTSAPSPTSPGPSVDSSLGLHLTRELDLHFQRLEATLRRLPSLPLAPFWLPDHSLIWIDGHPDWPELWRLNHPTAMPAGHRSPIAPPYSRLRRARPDELNDLDVELARRAGIDPHRRGWIRLDRRDHRGLSIDPTADDLRAFATACRIFHPD